MAKSKKAKVPAITEEQYKAMASDLQTDPIHGHEYENKFFDPGVAVKTKDGAFVTMQATTDGGAPHTITEVKGRKFQINWTYQPRDFTNGDDLIDDLWLRGQEQKPEMWVRPDGKVELLKGHRRFDAAAKMKALKPKDFVALFPEGFPCKVYKGLTEEQALKIRDDHDLDLLKQSLSSKTEVYNLLKPKMDMGWTVYQILQHCWRTIAMVMSNNYHKLANEVAELKTDKEKLDRIFSSQNGNYLAIRKVFNAPDILRQYWFDSEQGRKTPLLQKTFAELVTLFRSECEDALSGSNPEKYTQQDPGPEFNKAFTKAVKDLDVPAEEKVKPLTQKDRKALVEKCKSKIVSQTILAMDNDPAVMKQLMKDDVVYAELDKAMKVDQKAVLWFCGLILDTDYKLLGKSDRKTIESLAIVK